MDKEINYIEAKCPDFVCKECRTKVGWPHQRWCVLKDRSFSTCADCLYYSEKHSACIHPILKRKEPFDHEKIKRPV